MNIYIMHVGHPGNIDIGYTVTRKREIEKILKELPKEAEERSFFESDRILSAFPNGKFNCWGVPSRAEEPSFRETEIGDLVLFIPNIGLHDGGIKQIGIIKAKCPVRALHASRILWPKTPNDRLYPLLFFFDTEVGNREWYDFLDDVDYKQNWNPRGWYRKIDGKRFNKWGGTEGYLRFLRNDCGFKKI